MLPPTVALFAASDRRARRLATAAVVCCAFPRRAKSCTLFCTRTRGRALLLLPRRADVAPVITRAAGGTAPRRFVLFVDEHFCLHHLSSGGGS